MTPDTSHREDDAAQVVAWKARYDYLLTLIDAVEEDGDGMAGVAFSAQCPISLIDGKTPSQIADLLCRNAISGDETSRPQEQTKAARDWTMEDVRAIMKEYHTVDNLSPLPAMLSALRKVFPGGPGGGES